MITGWLRLRSGPQGSNRAKGDPGGGQEGIEMGSEAVAGVSAAAG